MISCYYDDDGSQVRLKIPLLQKFQIISKSERDLASKNYFAIKIIHNSHFFIIHTREERLFHEFLNKRVCFGREMVVEKKKENNMQMRKPSKSHLEWNSCKNISLARSTRGWEENEENSHPARCMSLFFFLKMSFQFLTKKMLSRLSFKVRRGKWHQHEINCYFICLKLLSQNVD